MSDKKTVVLTEKECYCGIIELYDLVAQKLGYDPAKVSYDCRRINVTKPVQDQIFTFYQEEQKASNESIGSAWLCYGPKAILSGLSGDRYEVEIFDGFIAARKCRY